MPTDQALVDVIRTPEHWLTAGGLSAEDRLRMVPPLGMTAEMVPQLHTHLSDDQIEVISRYFPSVGEAFPSFEFLLVDTPVDQSRVGSSLSIHTWGPKGPGSFELWTWVLVEKDTTPEMKELARKGALRAFGTSGNIEMDDGEAWPSQTRSARGGMGRRQKLRYQTFHGHNPPPGWPGPGQVHTGITRDDGQWGWWQRYFRYLLGEE